MSEKKTNLAEENAERTREGNQANVEGDDNSQVVDAGVPGQIQYPDRTVYAEQAAAFAAGKADTLYPEEETGDRQVYNTLPDRETGDETGEETEPAAVRGMGTDPNEDNEGGDTKGDDSKTQKRSSRERGR